MILEVPKTWIYTYHVAQEKFMKGVFSTKAAPLESVTVMLEGIYIDD